MSNEDAIREKAIAWIQAMKPVIENWRFYKTYAYRISPSQAQEIKKSLLIGVPQVELAKYYKVPRQTISLIANAKVFSEI